MATCDRVHIPITYDDVYGAVECPLCVALDALEEAMSDVTYYKEELEAAGVGGA